MIAMRTTAVLATLLVFPATCFGQAGKAELFGAVLDPAGLAVPAAKITAAETSTGARFREVSDAKGAYHLLGLPAGNYELLVEKPGFRPYRQTGLTLRLGDQSRLDIRLVLGQASESVDVNAEASLLQTAGGSVSYHVNGSQIETLPLDGRNFIPLVALSPGVALPGGGSLLPRINGSRPRTNEYNYDGISVLQPEPGQVAFYPVIDAIAEFRLNINSYSPEYGRSNGGAVMVIGKSGGNQLHGSLFEFFRNEDLNARNYFAPAGAKPEFRRNQYGLTLGGPLRRTWISMSRASSNSKSLSAGEKKGALNGISATVSTSPMRGWFGSRRILRSFDCCHRSSAVIVTQRDRKGIGHIVRF